MSIARCVSKIMDRIAPLALAEKWDNVSFILIPPLIVPERVRAFPILWVLIVCVRQVGLLLGFSLPFSEFEL